MMLPVVEKFVSINGEGAHAGELAAFIRFYGCNLSCSYCDTRWANRPDSTAKLETVQHLSDWVIAKGINNVTLTGGEPLLHDEISDLIAVLSAKGLRVEIETNGSVALDSFASMPNRPVFTMDYKLPSSNMEMFMQRDNFALLKQGDTVKFVAGSEEDLETALDVIDHYDLTSRCHVYFSPVFGKIKPSSIVDFMIDHRLNGVRLQLQLHKYIWEPGRRGV
ncbi:MAG: putative 7-carboxy-7-deazaguanine synthase QueE [Ruminococcus sp.]|nr:putative 7-carboxy-7-deazaguanine synthase QueE [Ruminococcus sp.]